MTLHSVCARTRASLFLAGWCLAALVCLGCSSQKDTVSLSPLTPAANATGQATTTRLAGPLAYGDALSINVWRHDDLSLETHVDEYGVIQFPLIGEVQASGKTLDELRTELRTRLAEYVADPQIRVELTSSSHRSIFVFGEVGTEGPVSLDHDVTLWEAISRSGGFTTDASESNVLIVRGAQGKGDMQLMLADMKLANLDPASGKDKDKDKGKDKAPQRFNFSGYLAPGDIVFVPPTTLASVERFMMRLRNILEAIASAERVVIFMPQVRDAILDLYYAEPPDYSDSSSSTVAGENISNQGGAVTPTQ